MNEYFPQHLLGINLIFITKVNEKDQWISQKEEV